MKKLTLIATVAFAVGLTSCGKSPEEQMKDAIEEGMDMYNDAMEDAMEDYKDIMNNY